MADSCILDNKAPSSGRCVFVLRHCVPYLLIIASTIWIGYLHCRIQEMSRRLPRDRPAATWTDNRAQPPGRYKRENHDIPSIGEMDNSDPYADQVKHKPKKIRNSDRNLMAYAKVSEATESLNMARTTLEKAMTYKHTQHPSIHLTPQPAANRTATLDKLKWRVAPSSAHDADPNSVYESTSQWYAPSGAGTVRVQRTGRYGVYAQVTFSGRPNMDSNLSDPSCGFQVRLEPNIGLMYNSVTQTRLGRSLQVDDQTHTSVYPHDSAYSSGVYVLRAGESVRVYHKEGVPCTVRTEPDKTYWGMWLLSEDT